MIWIIRAYILHVHVNMYINVGPPPPEVTVGSLGAGVCVAGTARVICYVMLYHAVGHAVGTGVSGVRSTRLIYSLGVLTQSTLIFQLETLIMTLIVT